MSMMYVYLSVIYIVSLCLSVYRGMNNIFKRVHKVSFLNWIYPRSGAYDLEI